MASLSWALRRGRATSIWSIAALLAAVVTGIAVYSYLSWLRAQIPVAGRLVPVVVASMDIAPGTELGAEHVELSKHPEHYLVPQSLTSLDAAIGKVASIPLFTGEPITSKKIGDEGGLSVLVPAGMRAYSLAASTGTGLGFAPRVGDRVDVIVTLPREVLGEPRTTTVLRGAEVAAIGSSSAEESGRVADQLGLEVSEGAVQLTLYVTPQDAERLAMAESLGRIAVVLAPGEPEGSAPEPLTPRDLLGD